MLYKSIDKKVVLILPTYSPLSSGVVYTELKKDNLRDKYYTNAPPQHKYPTAAQMPHDYAQN